MLLELPDGRELPVNYLREGDQVFVGVDGRWWRALREGNAPVTMLIRGETLTGKARVVFDDPAYKRAVFRPAAPNGADVAAGVARRALGGHRPRPRATDRIDSPRPHPNRPKRCTLIF